MEDSRERMEARMDERMSAEERIRFLEAEIARLNNLLLIQERYGPREPGEYLPADDDEVRNP